MRILYVFERWADARVGGRGLGRVGEVESASRYGKALDVDLRVSVSNVFEVIIVALRESQSESAPAEQNDLRPPQVAMGPQADVLDRR